MALKIREAVPADAPVITAFNLRLAEESEGLRLQPATVQAGVAAELSDPSKGVYYVAELDGAVVGQLMITYEWSDWRNGTIWWIQSVFVQPESRRAGVFRALFDHVRNLAQRRRDICTIRLYVHSENARARQSYERLGMNRTPYEVFELELRQGTEPACKPAR
jgi:GNAT superfamily N-acetyltransferase